MLTVNLRVRVRSYTRFRYGRPEIVCQHSRRWPRR